MVIYMTEEEVRNIIDDSTSNKVLVINDEDHTISLNEYYDVYVFTNLTADRTLNLPSATNYPNKRIKVVNATGGYYAIVNPSGTDYINDYNSTVEITEKYGWWEFVSDGTKWIGNTDGNSTVYREEGSVSAASNGAYYDLVALNNLTKGIYDIETFSQHNVRVSTISKYVYFYWGIGTIAGNNAPDIMTPIVNADYMDDDRINFKYKPQFANKKRYPNTTVKTIHLKIFHISYEVATQYNCHGYIEARRVA